MMDGIHIPSSLFVVLFPIMRISRARMMGTRGEGKCLSMRSCLTSSIQLTFSWNGWARIQCWGNRRGDDWRAWDDEVKGFFSRTRKSWRLIGGCIENHKENRRESMAILKRVFEGIESIIKKAEWNMCSIDLSEKLGISLLNCAI